MTDIISSTPDTLSPKWNEQGLIPVIAQEADTGEVLMLAWMNAEALEQTLTTVLAEEASVSRWGSGATSKKGSAVMVGGAPMLMLIFMEAARPKSSIAGRQRELAELIGLR